MTMIRLFPLRRSFSLDLAPDDSNSNFLLHAYDDCDVHDHPNHPGAHTFPPQLPVPSKSFQPNTSVIHSNMSAAVHWPVDDIDDALAADFDGSLSGLGIELGTASFNMSEALMALPSLTSLKHQEQVHHSPGPLSSNLLLSSSLHTNLSVMRHNDSASTSIERNIESPHIMHANSSNSNNLEDKPIAVVHGKKNRLAYGTEEESLNTSIKRFCLNNDRDMPNLPILLANHPDSLTAGDGGGSEEQHQCTEECYNGEGQQCHLRHSSSVPDLRISFNSAPPTTGQVSHSAASSPTSSTSTPSTTFFSQIISTQFHNNLSSNCHTSSPLTHELAHSAPRHSSKFQYVLGASTSMAIKMHEETMTYLNQGQSYEIKLKKIGDLTEMKGKMLKTILRVCFHDRRLQYMERELIEQWKEQRPSERILDVDYPLSYGVHDVRNDTKLINRSEFNWDPTKETGVFIRINCISTEFTPKKHGGEKGVPFRIVIETYCKESAEYANCLHAASCQVKVFKPKGADRKHKTDREKMNRKPASEQEKFQPSYDCTVFTDCSLDTLSIYSLSNQFNGTTLMSGNGGGGGVGGGSDSIEGADSGLSIGNKSNSQSKGASLTASNSPSPSSEKSISYRPYFNQLFSELNENSFDMNFSNFSVSTFKPGVLSSSASSEETQKWLKENRFDSYLTTFANFSGSDILLLSKEDLIQICGLTDGIRLYNAMHSKNVKSKLSIYICSPTEELFRAIYLDSLTVNELQSKVISTLLKSKCTYLKRLCIMGPSGVKILMTDDVVRNLPDESLYMVETSKDYNGEFHAVMKPYNANNASQMP